MRRLALFFLILSSCAFPVRASDCPGHYAGGQAPVIVKASLKPHAQEVCFQAFGVMHSGVSRGPLWSAEHLVRANVEDAETLPRKDSFHAEPRLPRDERAELADYTRSGFDRGHMSPNGDMPDWTAQGESFSLANMVPQIHANNAGIWAGIEAAVRRLAIQEGEVYVVTGPAFIGSEIGSLKNRVLIPTHLWKVVYSPRRQQAGRLPGHQRRDDHLLGRDGKRAGGHGRHEAAARRAVAGARRRDDAAGAQRQRRQPCQAPQEGHPGARSGVHPRRHRTPCHRCCAAPTQEVKDHPMSDFKPYANESDVLTLGNLAIKNRVDRVTLHGDVVLTRDRKGLALAKELKAVIDAIVKSLEAEKALPDRVEAVKPRSVMNPFA